MRRVKVNLTLDADITEAARSLILNMSRLAEAAIIEAAKIERNRKWRSEVFRRGAPSDNRSR